MHWSKMGKTCGKEAAKRHEAPRAQRWHELRLSALRWQDTRLSGAGDEGELGVGANVTDGVGPERVIEGDGDDGLGCAALEGMREQVGTCCIGMPAVGHDGQPWLTTQRR